MKENSFRRRSEMKIFTTFNSWIFLLWKIKFQFKHPYCIINRKLTFILLIRIIIQKRNNTECIETEHLDEIPIKFGDIPWKIICLIRIKTFGSDQCNSDIAIFSFTFKSQQMKSKLIPAKNTSTGCYHNMANARRSRSPANIGRMQSTKSIQMENYITKFFQFTVEVHFRWRSKVKLK